MNPALTKEEWARLTIDEGQSEYAEDAVADAIAESNLNTWGDARHALAALFLHGQPFGFTREDVELLREEAGHEIDAGNGREYRRLESLADRIEALLPPEES